MSHLTRSAPVVLLSRTPSPLLLPVWGATRIRRTQQGQATTEYALVLLGAAAIALLLVAWATKTGAFGSLLDAVLDSITKKVS